MTKKILPLEPEVLWNAFAQRNNLTPEQYQQFRRYYTMLTHANDIHNITAITDLKLTLTDHFDDSLALGNFVDCTKLKSLSDIGTGGGFPALPLKIKYPHVSCILIEVNHKKSDFLKAVIQELKLDAIEVSNLDWRTFLRKTEYIVDLFCARASLQPEELIRMFKPSSPYKNSQLVYWASKNWQAGAHEKDFITKEEWYTVGNKRRKLVFFAQPNIK